MVYLGDPLGFPRFFPIESPRISIRWALWTSRPRAVPRRRAVVTGIGFIGVGLISVREDRELRNAGKINLNRGIMRALLIWQSPSSRQSPSSGPCCSPIRPVLPELIFRAANSSRLWLPLRQSSPSASGGQ
jgi:hypothetical protein